ncbi:hypothetical protein Tco_1278869 [Tanacetum coccineum]
MSNQNTSLSQTLISIFKCEKYHHWSIKMSTLFMSQELWELSALDDDIFPRITSANTSNQAWEILKQEFLGDTDRKKDLIMEVETEDEEEDDSIDEVVVEVEVMSIF